MGPGRLEEWALRKGFVAAFCCVLALQKDAADVFTFGGTHMIGPGFAGFVAVMCHDETFGATYRFACSCVFGVSVALVITWILLVILQGTSSPYAALPLLFISTFGFSYVEFGIPMGQKLGISMLALFLVSYDFVPEEDLSVPVIKSLYFLADTVLGAVIAVVSCLVPPRRLAGLDLQKQARFGASAMARVFEDLVVAWQHQKYYCSSLPSPSRVSKVRVSYINEDAAGSSSAISDLGMGDNEYENGDNSITIPVSMVNCSSSTDDDDAAAAKRVTATAATTTTTNRYPKWRKISVFLRCVAAFKQPLRRRLRYSGSDIHDYRSTLAWLHSYRSQIRIDNYSLRTELQSFLVEKTTLMNKRLDEARWGPFRIKACTLYAPFISLLQKFLLIAKVMERRLKQMEALIGKDKRAKAVLYEFHRRPAFRSALRLYTARFGHALVVVSEVFAAHKTSELDGEFEQFLDKMAIELTELKALYRTFDAEYLRARKEIYYQDKQALLPEVLMAMNGFLFFNEWSLSLLEGFVEDSRSLYYKQQQAFLPWLMQRLCPSQRHLLPCFYSGSGDDKEKQQLLSPLVLRRIRNSACLATSMTIAGYFGLAASRQQPFMAAFTIAYLSGGSVTGMNLVTSINRALGTVLACVYAIAVLLCYEGLDDGAASSGANLFLAFAVVLFQIPCTYLRDRPVLSYAGIVASFSSILLLLDASFDASIAVDRIIDTFIGIVIFLVLELGLNSHASEDVILDDFAKTVDQVGSRFSHFLGTFREGRNNRKMRPSGTVAAAVKGMAAKKVAEPDFYAKRQLLVYNEAEPASFLRVGKVPRTMLENATSHLECCHHAISCLSMVSEYCDNHAGTGAGASEQDHLLAPLEAHLGDIDKLTSAACAQVKSNFGKLRDKSIRVTYAVPSQLMAMLQDACAGTDSSGNCGDANDRVGIISNASELHYRPLSAGSIKQLFALDNTISSRARAERVDKHNSSCYDCMDESAHSLGSSATGDSYDSSSPSRGVTLPGKNRAAECYLDDLEKELGSLLEALHEALSELQQQQLHQQRQEQQAVNADAAADGTAGAWNGMTNFEVKTVNAYLSSIIDFIHHLGLLAQVVRQMKSHRIIRLGAGSKKHL